MDNNKKKLEQTELSSFIIDWITGRAINTGKPLEEIGENVKEAVSFALQYVRNNKGLTNFISYTPTPNISVTHEENTLTPDIPVFFDPKPYTPTPPFALARSKKNDETPAFLTEYDIIEDDRYEETDVESYATIDTRIFAEKNHPTPTIDNAVYTELINATHPDIDDFTQGLIRALVETPISAFPPHTTPNSTDYGIGIIKALTMSTFPPTIIRNKSSFTPFDNNIAFYCTPTPSPAENE
jgi:hypothetical protein